MVEFGQFQWPGAYCGTLTVLLSMHPIPSRRPGRLDELISEEASIVGVPGGIPFCDGEVEFGHLPTQPVIQQFH